MHFCNRPSNVNWILVWSDHDGLSTTLQFSRHRNIGGQHRWCWLFVSSRRRNIVLNREMNCCSVCLPMMMLLFFVATNRKLRRLIYCFISSKHHLWISTTSIIVDRLVEVDLVHITLTTRPSEHLIGRIIDFIWYYGPAAPFQCHRVQPTLGGRSFDYYLQLTWSVMCSTFSRHIETIVFPGCILMLCCSDMMLLWCPPLSFRRMHVVCIHL
jgi:hypothetical protein